MERRSSAPDDPHRDPDVGPDECVDAGRGEARAMVVRTLEVELWGYRLLVAAVGRQARVAGIGREFGQSLGPRAPFRRTVSAPWYH